MAGINKVILIGRLGQDPEIRYTPDGTAVANFSVATSEQWNDKATGEKKERTEWHRIVAWRRLGEICGEYLSKGSQVYVEGRIQTRSWEKDGITRYSTEIIASVVQFLGGKDSGGQYENRMQNRGREEAGNREMSSPPGAASNTPGPPAQPAQEAQMDDIPF